MDAGLGADDTAGPRATGSARTTRVISSAGRSPLIDFQLRPPSLLLNR